MTTGDEPSLGGTPDLSGREPALGGSMGGGLTAALDGLTSADWQTRARSVKYLGDHRIGGAADRVVALLRDHNGQVRDAALRAAVRIGEPAVLSLIELLKTADSPKQVRTVILALSRIGGPALPHLFAAFDLYPGKVRVYIARILETLRHPLSIPTLITALGDDDAHFPALMALTSLGEDTIPHLLTALNSPDARIRASAAELLGTFQHQPAVPALIRLTEDADEDVQMYAIFALKDIASWDAMQVLLQLLDTGSIHQRTSVMRALALLNTPESTALLRNTICHDPAEEVRHEGLIGLSVREDPDLIPFYVEVVRDEAQFLPIRVLALDALRHPWLGSTFATVMLVLDSRLLSSLRVMIIGTLVHEPLRPVLDQLIRHASGQVAEAAERLVRVMHMHQDYPHWMPLNDIEDTSLRALAAEELRTLADPAAVPALIEHLHDPDEVWYYPFDGHGEGDLERITIGEICARALRRIGTPQALAALNALR
jgi:HEAT repeat protein